MWDWLWSVFNGILRGLESLASLIVGLGEAVVVLVTQAGTILGLLVQILWQMANVLSSLVGGLLATMQSASSPSYSWGPAQIGASKMSTALGLEAIGWLLAGLVWMIIAVSIIKVVSRRA